MAAVADIWYTIIVVVQKINSIKYNNQLYHGILTNQTHLGSSIKLSWKHWRNDGKFYDGTFETLFAN